jgi:hypothetical protein
MDMSATHGNGGSNSALAGPFIQLRHHGYRVSQLTPARVAVQPGMLVKYFPNDIGRSSIDLI